MTWREIVNRLESLSTVHPELWNREAMVNAGIDDRDPLKITGIMTAKDCECSNGINVHDQDIVLDTQDY